MTGAVMLALRREFEGSRVNGGRLSDGILLTKKQKGSYGLSCYHLGRRLQKSIRIDSSLIDNMAATRLCP